MNKINFPYLNYQELNQNYPEQLLFYCQTFNLPTKGNIVDIVRNHVRQHQLTNIMDALLFLTRENIKELSEELAEPENAYRTLILSLKAYLEGKWNKENNTLTQANLPTDVQNIRFQDQINQFKKLYSHPKLMPDATLKDYKNWLESIWQQN